MAAPKSRDVRTAEDALEFLKERYPDKFPVGIITPNDYWRARGSRDAVLALEAVINKPT